MPGEGWWRRRIAHLRVHSERVAARNDEPCWNRGIFVVVLCTYDEILPLKQ
jgi:hypothetical protein